jgi:7,8-dihydropterin-6-yl-methyl-4-(beta-D-ribofuranosyl)aminobenzene 5'-phosphate synthase
MKIVGLADNKTTGKGLRSVHGLSIYVETSKHKILFDVGPDDTLFHNAKALGIDLSDIDTVVISHGHYDHGGALDRFLMINNKAKIYIKRRAFDPYYHKIAFVKTYIGLNKELAENKRMVFTNDTERLDDELFIFSDVEGSLFLKSKSSLLKRVHGRYEPDDFGHEQNLIVTEEGRSVLFTGCSHKGIANIMITAKKHTPEIKLVLGGFHLMNPFTRVSKTKNLLLDLAENLNGHNAVFYTCHCTGGNAFKVMCPVMGENIKYLFAGTEIEI